LTPRRARAQISFEGPLRLMAGVGRRLYRPRRLMAGGGCGLYRPRRLMAGGGRRS